MSQYVTVQCSNQSESLIMLMVKRRNFSLFLYVDFQFISMECKQGFSNPLAYTITQHKGDEGMWLGSATADTAQFYVSLGARFERCYTVSLLGHMKEHTGQLGQVTAGAKPGSMLLYQKDNVKF